MFFSFNAFPPISRQPFSALTTSEFFISRRILLIPKSPAVARSSTKAEANRSRIINNISDLKRKAYNYNNLHGKKKRKVTTGNKNEIKEYYANKEYK
jgi:hypothetical protein